MLETLTARLNDILSICEAGLFDGVQIQVKPEYVIATQHIVIDLLGVQLSFVARAIDLANTIQPIPFRGETVRQLSQNLMNHSNSLEFHQSIRDYKSDLYQLADWIKAKQILSGESPPSDVDTGKKRQSASIDDMWRAVNELRQREVNPTKEKCVDLIRSWGMTIGGNRAHKMLHQLKKQSAVRPPESAD